ncbi:ribosome maturation factor RimM [Actinoalloteichus hymeniacidonis]|uniref:Ribosome maturation factor RimM n=1 Tax=Actinoalloteichus hymeniacidonis TaxID=340345 RepID=A0AAC9HNG1_9PSEU|nr:ribosome maturation factor RimM [Actinoalloteichus hymeniacidonis]AOS62569.1 16S rRNA processing protein RimM [Actinoalloteichus hymeniacidonis]MBB5909400.1 16S rRNA processing protein RimM [Actinoalloteichus hymeniacidonis]
MNRAGDPADVVLVGRVSKSHGIRGELVVDVRTDSPRERFAVDNTIDARLRDGSVQQLTVTAARPHGGRLLLGVAGIADRDGADRLRGALLTVPKSSLPPTGDDDEYYDHQLEGLAAILPDGSKLGMVREVLHGAGGDLLSVRLEEGDDVLIPFVREIVPTVDIPAGRLIVDPPPGLVDDQFEE